MYKRLAVFFFRMIFNHAHNLSKFASKKTCMQFVEKTFTVLYYLILRLFTDQTLIKFVY